MQGLPLQQVSQVQVSQVQVSQVSQMPQQLAQQVVQHVQASQQAPAQVQLPADPQQLGAVILQQMLPVGQVVQNMIQKKRRRTDGDAAGGRAKLTLKDKFDILTYWDQFPEQQNYAAIGRKYDVSRQSIRKVIQSRELILQDYHNGVPHDAKRCRVLPPDMALLDEKVLEYINSLPAPASNMKRNVLPINMEMLKAKATEIATTLNVKINKGRSTESPWIANNTWYARFCNRHNFIREPLPVENPIVANLMAHQQQVASSLIMEPVSVALSVPTMVEEQKPENTSMMFVGLKDDDSSVDSQG